MKYEKININYEINKINARSNKEFEHFNYKKQYLINKNYTVVSNKSTEISLIDRIIPNKLVDKYYLFERKIDII